jgi:hypothetical protein
MNEPVDIRLKIFAEVLLIVVAGATSAFGQWANCGTDVCTQSTTANVGVGTTPQAKLHVDTDNNEALRLSRSNAGWSYMATYRGATRQGVVGDLSTNGFGLWADSTVPLAFVTNTFLRMLIDSNGNVGIGTNAPGAKLHVTKSSTYNNEATAGFVLTDAMPAYNIKLDAGVDNAAGAAYLQTQIPTAYTKNLALQPMGGNVGINKINPSLPLEVNGYVGSTVTPPNDTTPAVAGMQWSNRGAGGGAYRWLFAETSPDGAYGLSPNGLELYEYPNTGTPSCCIPRLIFRKASSSTVSPAAVVVDGAGHMGLGGVWAPYSAYTLDIAGTLHATGDAVIDGAVSTTGNLGLGTTTPGAKLHITKSSTYNNESSAGLVLTDTMPSYNIKLDAGVDNAAGVAYLQTQIPTGYTKNLALQPVAGNVGINKTNPSLPLDVNGYLGSTVTPPNDTTPAVAGVQWSNRGPGGGAYRWLFAETSPDGAYGLSPNGLELYEYPNTGTPSCCIPRLIFRRASSATVTPPAIVVDGAGHMALGGLAAPGPSYVLDISGTFHATGDAVIDGNIAAKYQDVAEWVDASEAMIPGTVVVVDPDAVNGVRPSSSSYDTGVAGVVSAQPGITLGQAGEAKEKIATTGRVKVRVDATRIPIRTGDLLVTSDEPGVAMRSEPIDVAGVKLHRPGTLIGKALEPLRSGRGEILVLLSLQ